MANVNRPIIQFIYVLQDTLSGTKQGLINSSSVEGMQESTATQVSSSEEIPSPCLSKSLSTYKVVKTLRFLNTLLVIKYTIMIFLRLESLQTRLKASKRDNFFLGPFYLSTKPTFSSSNSGNVTNVCGLGDQNM